MANEGGGPPLGESRFGVTKKAKKTFKQRGAERRAEQAAKKKAKEKAKAEAKKAKQTAKDKKRLKDAKKTVAYLERELKRLERERKTKVWKTNSAVRKHLAEIKSVKRNINHSQAHDPHPGKEAGHQAPVAGHLPRQLTRRMTGRTRRPGLHCPLQWERGYLCNLPSATDPLTNEI
jgi:septal ring factor EnvC (AmiA/AmiB activator)